MRDRWVDGVQCEFEQNKDVSAYMTDLKAALRAKENARKRKSSIRNILTGSRHSEN